MANFGNTQDLVDIKEIRDSAVIMKSGKLLNVVMVDGINFSLKSEEEQNIITYAYQNFLNSIDFSLQVVIHSRKINIENYLAAIEERQNKEPSALIQNQIGEYREFISSFIKDNAIMQKTFFVAIPWSHVSLPTASGVTSFLPFGKKDKGKEEAQAKAQEANLEQNLSQLKQRTDQVISGLQTIGLEAVQLGDEELAELFYNFYNPETVERERMHLTEAEKAR